jgi:hypothetical protein
MKTENPVFLTDTEKTNLLDALNEWAEIVGPKELAPNEIGLDVTRYENLVNKLKG